MRDYETLNACLRTCQAKLEPSPSSRKAAPEKSPSHPTSRPPNRIPSSTNLEIPLRRKPLHEVSPATPPRSNPREAKPRSPSQHSGDDSDSKTGAPLRKWGIRRKKVDGPRSTS